MGDSIGHYRRKYMAQMKISRGTKSEYRVTDPLGICETCAPEMSCRISSRKHPWYDSGVNLLGTSDENFVVTRYTIYLNGR